MQSKFAGKNFNRIIESEVALFIQGSIVTKDAIKDLE